VSLSGHIAFGAAANWFSRGVTILLGLVLMPVLFRHLPKEELGVWLLLGQSWAAMGILDLGFGVTLTRRFALAKGKSGSDPQVTLTPEALHEIADLVAAGRRIYRFMAFGVFLVSWAVGFFYVRNLELLGLSHATVWMAWTILCICQALTVWATVWTCLLQGVGYIGWDSLIASLFSTGMLIAQIIAVLCGGGLIALATIAAVTTLFQRAMIRWFGLHRRPELFSLRGSWNPNVLKGIPGLAFRAWLTSVGLVLVLNTDQLFIAKMQGAAGLPGYRAGYLALLNLNMISVTFASASAVFISHLWQSGEFHEVQRIVIRNLRIGLSMMACGGACILALGPRLFDLWLGPGNFIGYPIMTVFFVLLILEAQCFIVATSSRATEDEAFTASALTAGLLKLSLSFVLGLRYGLLGIALGTLFAQLTTNHWFMVYRGLRRLRMSLRSYATQVVLPTLLAFALTLAAVAGVRTLLYSYPPWSVVLASMIISSGFLAAILWTKALDPSQRARLLIFVWSRNRPVALEREAPH
jgi:O-antigen/teichoic acid export membrane protein